MDFEKKQEGISQIHVGKFVGDETDTKQVEEKFDEQIFWVLGPSKSL